MEHQSPLLLLVAIFGGIPLSALIAGAMGLWTRDQAKTVYKETLVTELQAFQGRLLKELDERFTLAAGSKITGREAENRLVTLEEVRPRSRSVGA